MISVHIMDERSSLYSNVHVIGRHIVLTRKCREGVCYIQYLGLYCMIMCTQSSGVYEMGLFEDYIYMHVFLWTGECGVISL